MVDHYRAVFSLICFNLFLSQGSSVFISTHTAIQFTWNHLSKPSFGTWLVFPKGIPCTQANGWGQDSQDLRPQATGLPSGLCAHEEALLRSLS
jgi:hypothetical protein